MKIAAIPLLLTALVTGCVETRTCTTIGCQDQARVSLRRGDGAPLDTDLFLNIDGRSVVCGRPDPGTGSLTCDTGVRISSRELTDCHEVVSGTNRSLQCVGTGRFELVVEIDGTPKSLSVGLLVGGDAVLDGTLFEPTYETFQPNGPDCEPICRQWSGVWEVRW